MQHRKSGLAALLVALLATPPADADTLPLPDGLIGFASPTGREMLLRAGAREDYWALSQHFVTQKTQSYCGVATSVMVLNALGLPPPPDPVYAPYGLFTQDNFFDARTEAVVAAERVAQRGMTLDQLGGLLAAHGARVAVHHAGDGDLDSFRSSVAAALARPGDYVLVNYLRRALGQDAGGHISPLAAYDAETDRFLILDVSRYKYPPAWVPAAALWQAMNTVDADSGLTRGYVLAAR